MMRRRYRERPDELAQDIIDTWNAAGTNFTPEFGALVHKAILFKAARQKAENHRAFDILSTNDELKESVAALTLVRAYEIYFDRQAARFN